ncbi:sulfotransferase [Actibacterium pelagium]|uniref:sulfotransferase n=1 Tax=Actibacterium pelagium TaxID=2029103 RepID=UPI001E46115F|nr:sulfotransferase [Actibacterium pelagium]
MGFNKCATRSFSQLFERAGHASLHHKIRKPLQPSRTAAKRMKENIEGNRPVFEGFDDYVFYCDLVHVTPEEFFEGNSAYKEILKDYSDTLIILNLRDQDDWIRSRLRHGHGEFAKRYMSALGLDNLDDLAAHWRQDWDEQLKGVREFMDDKPEQYFEFNIDTDNIEDLISALPDYQLDACHWGDSGNSRFRKLGPVSKRAKKVWANMRPRSTN